MQRSFQSSSGAAELTDPDPDPDPDSRNFLLREQTLGSNQTPLGHELNEKVVFRKLPRDVLYTIDQELIDNRSVRFCRRLSSIIPNIRMEMDPEDFFKNCSEFMKEVQVFIERMCLGDINPTQQFEGVTCLSFVESNCLSVLEKMLNYRYEKREQLDILKIQIEMLREMIVYAFAVKRNAANKEMLEKVLNDSNVEEILRSTERLIILCINTLKSNTDPSVVKDFETRALTLLEECSDILVSIITNERISIKLKKKTMDLFTYIMHQMFSIFQQAQDARLRSKVQHSTYEKYRELKIKYNAIKKYLEEKYPPPPAQGGNSQKKLINKSKRKNRNNKNSINRKNKNKKIKKKTLRLRL